MLRFFTPYDDELGPAINIPKSSTIKVKTDCILSREDNWFQGPEVEQYQQADTFLFD